MSEFSYYAAQVVDGVAYGSIYGVFALSIVLLYRANKLFNLAQTEMATLSVIVGFFLLKSFPIYVAIPLAVTVSFFGGVALHLGIMRFVTERKNVLHSNESAITIGFFTIFNSFSSYILGDEPQAFPSPFGTQVFQVLGVGISLHSIGILASTIVMIFLLYLGFRLTKIGLVFEAVAENISAARLRGIRASNVLALAWGLTMVTSSLGAMLIAPVLFVTPSMLTSIAAYSFISVVIGGLESPLGALVGGIIVGVVENLASNLSFIGAELKFVVVMILLVLVLIVRPRGLWGRAEGRRV